MALRANLLMQEKDPSTSMQVEAISLAKTSIELAPHESIGAMLCYQQYVPALGIQERMGRHSTPS